MDVTRAMVRERWAKLTDLSTRLGDMDAAAVAVQVVSPSPGHYHGWADAAAARALWQGANEGIAALCRQAPERLVGLGMAPVQHGDEALAALEDAVLRCGLRGVEISSHAPGPDGGRPIELSAPHLEPFWARAAELDALVFLHPLGCTLDERLDRWYLANVVGMPVEHAVALSHLIFGGVLDRHPGLRLLAAHGGGYLPTYLGRADHAWANRPDSHSCAEPPSSYARRLWFDSLVHSPTVLRALVDAAGVDRVLVGSDYPFDMGVADPVQRLLDAGLGEDANRAIARGNAEALGLVPTRAR
jgi:aminocarboxymuconate-semialdehyde decarboxylase